MSIPTPDLTYWLKQHAADSDEKIWNDYVRNQRNWNEEDGTCHSTENVLSEVLTHRGIIAPDPQEVLWAALEALVPNRCDIKGALLSHIRENDYLFQQAKERIAFGLTAAKHRGERVGLGKFVHNRDAEKRLTLERPWKVLSRDEAGHAVVDVTAMANHTIDRMAAMIPEFCKRNGIREDQVEIKTAFLVSPDGSEHMMRAWLAKR